MRTLNWAQVKDRARCPASTLTQLMCSPDLWPRQGEGPGHCGTLNLKASRYSHPPILSGSSRRFFWAGLSPLPGPPAPGSAKNLTRLGSERLFRTDPTHGHSDFRLFPNRPWDILWARLCSPHPEAPPSVARRSQLICWALLPTKMPRAWKEGADPEPLPLGAALGPCLACGAEPAFRHSSVPRPRSPHRGPSEDTTQNFQLCSVRVRT